MARFKVTKIYFDGIELEPLTVVNMSLDAFSEELHTTTTKLETFSASFELYQPPPWYLKPWHWWLDATDKTRFDSWYMMEY